MRIRIGYVSNRSSSSFLSNKMDIEHLETIPYNYLPNFKSKTSEENKIEIKKSKRFNLRIWRKDEIRTNQ